MSFVLARFSSQCTFPKTQKWYSVYFWYLTSEKLCHTQDVRIQSHGHSVSASHHCYKTNEDYKIWTFIALIKCLWGKLWFTPYFDYFPIHTWVSSEVVARNRIIQIAAVLETIFIHLVLHTHIYIEQPGGLLPELWESGLLNFSGTNQNQNVFPGKQ